MGAQNAGAMWNALRGIVCVYKPAECSVRKLRQDLITKICKGLNEIDENQYYRPFKPHTSNTTELIQRSVDRSVDLRDHPLVYGPKFDELDLAVSWSNFLGWNTSGVLRKSCYLLIYSHTNHTLYFSSFWFEKWDTICEIHQRKQIHKGIPHQRRIWTSH
nr:unnamed protein product [Callosobruchus chinensis]